MLCQKSLLVERTYLVVPKIASVWILMQCASTKTVKGRRAMPGKYSNHSDATCLPQAQARSDVYEYSTVFTERRSKEQFISRGTWIDLLIRTSSPYS
jgi:hypothetical protein